MILFCEQAVGTIFGIATKNVADDVDYPITTTHDATTRFESSCRPIGLVALVRLLLPQDTREFSLHLKSRSLYREGRW